MRRWIGLALALPATLSISLPAPAQIPTQPPPPPTATLRAQARLVVVDVVVTDKAGNPVHNLKQTDFQVSEKNVPQKIKAFGEHSAVSAEQAGKFPPLPKLPPGTFTNFVPTPVNSAVNILLLDALNTPLADQAYVHAQVLDYLKHPRAGTSMAIFGLTTQLRMLQGFTSDPDLLREIASRQLGRSSALLDDPLNGATTESVADQMGDIGVVLPADVAANMQTFQNMTQSFQLQLRARYTLDAMNQLARYLAGIPGRKNLIWFSGSFPINILPDSSGDASDPFAAVASSEDEYRETTNLLARAQVAVYPIDGRGLMVSPNFSAANANSRFARNPRSLGQAESDFFNKTADEHSTMRRMAEDTGGRAFVNTNGLSQAVSTAIQAGSNYYTLAYTPEDAKWNGNFRSIQVKLEEKGYTLAFRHGYYADDPDSKFSALASTSGAAPGNTASPSSPNSAIVGRAMAHGLPGPSEIVFKMRVLPSSAEPENSPAEGNAVPQSKAKGPWRRFAVDVAADAHNVLFTRAADNTYHASVQFLSLVYTADGDLVNTALHTVQAAIPESQLRQMLLSGIHFHQEISVPDRGVYSLRVGVFDLRSSRIGATEIPIAAVKNLAPVPPPAASSSSSLPGSAASAPR